MNKAGTLRFEVNLDANNTENYEISLLDLMKQYDKNVKNSNKEEIEEINNYVKQLEKKYGPVAVVKGKKIRVNDFLIQGSGYDADDPFIDDSGTDEAIVVAPDLMTQYGGFFINDDTLKLNESSFVIERVEGEDDSALSTKQHFPIKTSKLTKSQQLLSQAKKRLSTTKKLPISTSNHSLDQIINDVVSVNVRKEETDNIKVTKKIEVPIETPVVTKSPEKEQANSFNYNNNQAAAKSVSLPSDIPDVLKNKITSLIGASKSWKIDGNKLSTQSNILLMEIDMILQSKSHSKTLRTQVLRYISSVIDVKYDSILRKINKFRETKRKQVQYVLLQSFHDAVTHAMVDSQAKYDSDMGLYLAKIEAQKLYNASTTAPTDASQINIDLTSNQESPELRQAKPPPVKINHPKRLFKWSASCKSIFFKMVADELDSLKNGKSKITPEEHLTKFFTSTVLNCWPAKWMTNQQLMKLSFGQITDFKNTMTNGKETKTDLPVKPKPVQKVKMQTAKPKETAATNNIKQVDSKTKPDTAIIKEIPTNSPMKVVISPTKQSDKVISENHSVSSADSSKSRLSETHKDKISLIAKHQQPQLSKVRKSSPPLQIQSPQLPNHHNISRQMSPPFVANLERPVTNRESLKRASIEIIDGSPAPKQMMTNHQNSPIRQRTKTEKSLPQFYNQPIYLNTALVQASCASTGSPTDLHIRRQTVNSSANHFQHSSPYTHLVNNVVSPDVLHKISPNRHSNMQSISSMLNSNIETRQNIPQHIAMVNKSQNNLTSITQHNLQQAQNLQRHFINMQPGYESSNKNPFHQHPNAPTIDLIESPIPMNAHQIPSDMYYNFSSAAHYNNQRRYQN